MKNNKLCKKLCDMVDLYQNSEHPINEIISAMKLNIQDIFEENLTKHNSSFIQELLQDIDYHIQGNPYTESKDFLLKLSKKIEQFLK